MSPITTRRPDCSREEALRLWAAALLTRDTEARAPPVSDHQTIDAFLQHHGLEPLIAERAASHPVAGVPFASQSTMRRAAAEIARQEEFVRVLRTLRLRSRPPALVFKGQALAYTVYPKPWLRPRVDIDILIDRSDVDGMEKLLLESGYQRLNAIDGDLVLRQAIFTKRRFEITHSWDVHWAISNRPALARSLSYESLLETAEEVKIDGETMVIPSHISALLISGSHLIGHHGHDVRLIWLYDIHLLAQALPMDRYDDLLRAARDAPEIRSACHAALSIARRYMPSPAVNELCGLLDPGTRAWPMTTPWKLTSLLEDARAVERGARLRFIRQHLFPSRQYMTVRFGIKQRWQLPFWYVVRIGRAVPKLFRRR